MATLQHPGQGARLGKNRSPNKTPEGKTCGKKRTVPQQTNLSSISFERSANTTLKMKEPPNISRVSEHSLSIEQGNSQDDLVDAEYVYYTGTKPTKRDHSGAKRARSKRTISAAENIKKITANLPKGKYNGNGSARHKGKNGNCTNKIVHKKTVGASVAKTLLKKSVNLKKASSRSSGKSPKLSSAGKGKQNTNTVTSDPDTRKKPEIKYSMRRSVVKPNERSVESTESLKDIETCQSVSNTPGKDTGLGVKDLNAVRSTRPKSPKKRTESIQVGKNEKGSDDKTSAAQTNNKCSSCTDVKVDIIASDSTVRSNKSVTSSANKLRVSNTKNAPEKSKNVRKPRTKKEGSKVDSKIKKSKKDSAKETKSSIDKPLPKKGRKSAPEIQPSKPVKAKIRSRKSEPKPDVEVKHELETDHASTALNLVKSDSITSAQESSSDDKSVEPKKINPKTEKAAPSKKQGKPAAKLNTKRSNKLHKAKKLPTKSHLKLGTKSKINIKGESKGEETESTLMALLTGSTGATPKKESKNPYVQLAELELMQDIESLKAQSQEKATVKGQKFSLQKPLNVTKKKSVSNAKMGSVKFGSKSKVKKRKANETDSDDSSTLYSLVEDFPKPKFSKKSPDSLTRQADRKKKSDSLLRSSPPSHSGSNNSSPRNRNSSMKSPRKMLLKDSMRPKTEVSPSGGQTQKQPSLHPDTSPNGPKPAASASFMGNEAATPAKTSPPQPMSPCAFYPGSQSSPAKKLKAESVSTVPIISSSPPHDTYQALIKDLPNRLYANRHTRRKRSDSDSDSDDIVERRLSVRQSESVYKYKEIIVRKLQGYTQVLLFTNTKLKNSLNPKVMQEIVQALHNAKFDDSRLVLLSGHGGTFCSGVDLQFLLDDRKTAARAMASSLRDFVNTLIAFPKPIVVAVNGPTMGLGAAILPLCDIVYASDKATFSMPYTKLAQTPEGCSSYTFPNAMGLAMANELLLGGRKLTAIEACQVGLVSQVFWPTSMMQEVIPRVQNIATHSATALEASKILMRSHQRAKLEYTNENECHMLSERWASYDCQKALKTFIDKELDL